MRKRSVTIDGHRTSVSLEDAFWVELAGIAARRGLSLAALVAEIDHARALPGPDGDGPPRANGNLSSALRLHVLEDLRRRTISRA
jgi:predicted DNA-binding ribbon-helix-helix protein